MPTNNVSGQKNVIIDPIGAVIPTTSQLLILSELHRLTPMVSSLPRTDGGLNRLPRNVGVLLGVSLFQLVRK